MDSSIYFFNKLNELVEAAEKLYQKTGITIYLEPDLYDRVSFTLKKSTDNTGGLNKELDSGRFKYWLYSGHTVTIVKDSK